MKRESLSSFFFRKAENIADDGPDDVTPSFIAARAGFATSDLIWHDLSATPLLILLLLLTKCWMTPGELRSRALDSFSRLLTTFAFRPSCFPLFCVCFGSRPKKVVRPTYPLTALEPVGFSCDSLLFPASYSAFHVVSFLLRG